MGEEEIDIVTSKSIIKVIKDFENGTSSSIFILFDVIDTKIYMLAKEFESSPSTVFCLIFCSSSSAC